MIGWENKFLNDVTRISSSCNIKIVGASMWALY